MPLIVQKYGGSSVGTPERIKNVARRIQESVESGNSVVVVVSAMGDTTDELIALAEKVSLSPPRREMDMLLTAGERISMALLSMALSDLGVSAVSFTGSQSGIITDSQHRRAKIKRVSAHRVKEAISKNQVAIVAGFQGVSEEKEVTTLGRGGSDTTAVALAAVLEAVRCEIFTDVDGVYSADPRKVPTARLLKTLSHDQVLEMANLGAQVLHPRSIELAKYFRVPLYVRNSLKQGSYGTEVIPISDFESVRITAITADYNRRLWQVTLARLTAGLAVLAAAQSTKISLSQPIFYDGKMFFFGENEFQSEISLFLSRLVQEGFVINFQIPTDVVPLSVIGTGVSTDPSLQVKVLESLAEIGISVTMGIASSLSFTVGVGELKCDQAIAQLHHRLIGEM